MHKNIKETETPSDFSAMRGNPDFMLSLARGIQVITAFSQRRSAATISEIALQTHLDRAVVRRCLYTLEHLGMVEQNDRKYRLTPQVLSIGHAYFSSAEIVLKAQPLLDKLGDKIHTNCALAILSDYEILYLVRSQSKKLLERSLGLGSRLPAYCTSLGRVLLAHLSSDELDTYFKRTQLTLYTEFTSIDEQQLRGILEHVKQDGYAIVEQEMALGLSGISIPIRTNKLDQLMALSVTVNPKYVHNTEIKRKYMPDMLELATQLEQL